MEINKKFVNGVGLTFASEAEMKALDEYVYARIDAALQTPLLTHEEVRVEVDTMIAGLVKEARRSLSGIGGCFAISALRDAAQLSIKQAEVMCLSRDDQECFARELIDPPSASSALLRAFARHEELLCSDTQ
ncbi:type II toxin -antitoxin system TacA 1-like antitoxin [Cardiobacterium valvarum]|uniref:Toxin-antitoxin system, antitoxin component, ribbon-helix-helix domain protein n=1 Tax=Cardiobacterium valvarum F0432 TaxID=797473 RepID=G9ZJB5_9GAMM|nr:DUF1778 domain-containing protein [Cardiobacterium valvarum]EHM50256.1 toxin-antitoxin system, antitoxin component, ribbon-helix-helix domain protein [Cardiobacterium valvarum F0432]